MSEKAGEGQTAQERLQAKALERLRERGRAGSSAPVPGAAADLRAATEDDDGYDPYSDYMDQLARSSYEEPSADPWR